MNRLRPLLVFLVALLAISAQAAKTAYVAWELQFGGNPHYAGCFDPSLTASMDATLSATSANTASPVVASSNYNFVAGDVGNYLYVASGTNWVPGWYKIASVATNKATLSAACATVASPTSGTWTVDYSRSTSAILTVSDGITNGTTLVTSVAGGFKVSMVGNGIYDSGTSTDRYLISAVPTANHLTLQTATADTGSGRTITIGGALGAADPFACFGSGGYAVAGNYVFLLYSASGPFTTASAITPPGYDSSGASGRTFQVVGYDADANRNIGGTPTNKPTLRTTASVFCFGGNGQFTRVRNLIGDENNESDQWINSSGEYRLYGVDVINSNNIGFYANNPTSLYLDHCSSTTTLYGFQNCTCWNCTAITTTTGSTIGFTGNCYCVGCAVKGDGSANAIGFGNTGLLINCTAYNCPIGYEFNAGAAYPTSAYNCLSESCTTAYHNGTASLASCALYACASYGATTVTTTGWDPNMIYNGAGAVSTVIVCSVDPLVSASTGNFSLNNTASGGALLRGTGYGIVNGQTGYVDIGALQHQDSGGGGGNGHVIGSGAELIPPDLDEWAEILRDLSKTAVF